MKAPPTKEARTALDALQGAITWGLLGPFRGRGPGQVILSLPAATREALAKLTSDDLATLRIKLPKL